MTNSRLPPVRECDVVMKGGVASGVVYAGAIFELAREFRFRSIGGTSAGAIGAALCAAAEFRRQRDNRRGLADLLEPVMRDLATPGFFSGLLKATPEARPVVRILLAALRPGRGPARRVLGVLWWTLASRWWLALGVAAGASVLTWQVLRQPSAGAPLTTALIGMVIVLAAILTVGGAALMLLLATKRTIEEPRNRMGLCSGMSADRSGPGVTEWLHRTLQDVAGLPSDKPLTFGHLEAERIELAMITTDLGASRPVRLPPANGVRPAYWYDPADMRALFPPSVCTYLDTLHADRDAHGLHPLPAAELPVIVALRMSLSLPLLLAAIRLYGADDVTGQPSRERYSWFSDGGITSNFPIHFFDTWLPLRPTFGLDLQPQSPPHLDRVVLPLPDDPPPPRWQIVTGAVPLLRQVADAAQNWRDTAQAELPGYRERVVQVRLRAGEGGMNLDMAPETTWELIEAGREAGRRLARAFDARGLERHQARRFVILLRLLQSGLDELGMAFARVSKRLRTETMPEHPAYRGQFARRARRATANLLATARQWRQPPGGLDFERGIEVKPPPAMRVGQRL